MLIKASTPNSWQKKAALYVAAEFQQKVRKRRLLLLLEECKHFLSVQRAILIGI